MPTDEEILREANERLTKERDKSDNAARLAHEYAADRAKQRDEARAEVERLRAQLQLWESGIERRLRDRITELETEQEGSPADPDKWPCKDCRCYDSALVQCHCPKQRQQYDQIATAEAREVKLREALIRIRANCAYIDGGRPLGAGDRCGAIAEAALANSGEEGGDDADG